MARRVQLKEEVFLRALFYGDPGSTKTRTTGSAALDERLSPVLYLNASGNPISIRDYEKQPDIVDMEKLPDFNAPYDWLVGGQKPDHVFPKTMGLERAPYKTVIIDQLTDVQRMAFRVVLGAQSVGPGDFPVKREWAHYNKVLYQMTNFAKLYFSLPMHVIMTALETAKTNEETGSVKYMPSLEGTSIHEVPGYALLVGRLVPAQTMRPALYKAVVKANDDVEPDYSVVFFKPSSRFLAKNQYGNELGDFLVDPSMTDIIDGIMSSS